MSTTVAADGLQASSDKSHLSFTFLSLCLSPLRVLKVTSSSARILRVMYGSDPLYLSLSAEIRRGETMHQCFLREIIYLQLTLLLCFFFFCIFIS